MKRYFFCALLIYVICIQSKGLQAQSTASKADSLLSIGNYVGALKIHEEILQNDINSNNEENRGKDYNNIANVYTIMGEYEKSTEFYFKAIPLIEKTNNQAALATLYYNVASNYYAIGKLDYSIDFLNKSLHILTSSNGDKFMLAMCYNLLGGIKTTQHQFKEAFNYFKQAEHLFSGLKKNEYLANVYTNISNLKLEEENYIQAREYSRKSISIFIKENDMVGVSSAYLNLYKSYFDPIDTGTVLNRKEVLQFITYLDSADYVVKNINSPELKTNIYNHKQYVYSRLNQYDSAYAYHIKYSALKDSIHDITKNKQLEELKIQYDFQKKEQENALLQKTNQNQFYVLIILIITILALILIGLLLFRLNKLRAKQNSMQLEQKLLRLQMNPHFLFNAINGIQRYILKNNQQEAYDYLTKFSKLMRIVLNNSQEKTLILHQELEMIKLYIELEQLRFNNAFSFTLTIGKEVNEYELAVPAMLIQPYIENAIWHGLMNLNNERKGILTVTIEMMDELLKIVIEDNGIGRERAMEYKKEDGHQSVGMKLTEQRLVMINKMDAYEHAKVLVNDVTDINGTICGTRVEIYIPVNDK